MAQWHECKAKAGTALLFFRLGDFYEAFYEDALTLAKELEITLTKRQDVPMAGVPFHAAENYIDKLISKGYCVAIAEQMEEAKAGKGLVRREIVRVVTPGTVVGSSLTVDKSNQFLACIVQVNRIFGLSFLDITTAEFLSFEFDSMQEVLDEIYRLNPKEILVAKTFGEKHPQALADLKIHLKVQVHHKPDSYFEHASCCHILLSHFKVHQLDCFGLQGMICAINAAGAILRYITCDLNLNASHLKKISSEGQTSYMRIDRTTHKHLELTESLHHTGRTRTLLGTIDDTETPMGGRLLKKWLLHPLLSVGEIEKRQDAVSVLLEDTSLLKKIKEHLKEIRDLERLIMRIETGYAGPRDLLSLAYSLEHVAPLYHLLPEKSELLTQDKKALTLLSPFCHKILHAIQPNPPLRLSEGDIFQKGFNSELDALKKFKEESALWLGNYQTQLREETQIKTLKVGYTQAFGFYIEVSKGQCDKVPSSFFRRQTLVNAERFLTEELKEYEYKSLHADEKIKTLEQELFHSLRKEIALDADKIRTLSAAIGRIDTLASFAAIAHRRRYVRPTVDEGFSFVIKAGRHPVLEEHMEVNAFIANDLSLNDTTDQLVLLTGPNMAGKSTYIRQAALIAILAQIGSFVPAESCQVGVIDKVFTRIGASDDLTKGQSTFMVEMAETANILNHATCRSLVILDEIGRGTSTYDGIAIAWSIAEHLLTEPSKKAKTLFATHYFELTSLEQKLKGAVNYTVAVEESKEGITFLHKIVKGSTDRSYGIHVAKLAGLPEKVIFRAQEILFKLEKHRKKEGKKGEEKQVFEQLSFLDYRPLA